MPNEETTEQLGQLPDDAIRKMARRTFESAIVFYNQNDHTLAIQAFNTAILSYEWLRNLNNEDHTTLALCANHLSDIYFKNNNVDAELEFSGKAIAYQKKFKARNEEESDNHYRSLADYFYYHAISYFRKNLSVQQCVAYRQAIFHREKIIHKKNEDHILLAIILGKLGTSYLEQHDPILAENNYRQALSYCQKINHTFPDKRNLATELSERINITQKFSALKNEAQLWGFACHDVTADGDCFFHAIAHQLSLQNIQTYKGLTEKDLRERTVQRIEKYFDAYFTYIDGDQCTYLEQLRLQGEWADSLAISVLARELNVNLIILNSTELAPVIFKQSHPVGTLYLGYMEDFHYQSLQRRTDWTPTKSIQDLINKTSVDTFDEGHVTLKRKPEEAENTGEDETKRMKTRKLFHSLFAKQASPVIHDTQPNFRTFSVSSKN